MNRLMMVGVVLTANVSNAQSPTITYVLESTTGTTVSMHDATKRAAIPLPPDVPWMCYTAPATANLGAGFGCMPTASFQTGNTKTIVWITATCTSQKRTDAQFLEFWAGDPPAFRIKLIAACTTN